MFPASSNGVGGMANTPRNLPSGPVPDCTDTAALSLEPVPSLCTEPGGCESNTSAILSTPTGLFMRPIPNGDGCFPFRLFLGHIKASGVQPWFHDDHRGGHRDGDQHGCRSCTLPVYLDSCGRAHLCAVDAAESRHGACESHATPSAAFTALSRRWASRAPDPSTPQSPSDALGRRLPRAAMGRPSRPSTP